MTLETWKFSGTGGFTLLELVLATLISSLVIGILSVCLSFSLRTWEKQGSRERSSLPEVLDLLKMQLAQFEPTTIRMDQQSRPLFLGEAHTLAFATDHSIRAISRGVPVVARYVFDEKGKRLLYAEMPLDTYHPDRIGEFLKIRPSTHENSWPRFFPIDIDEFSLSYGGGKRPGFFDTWDNEESEPPSSVLVKWSRTGDPVVHSLEVIPNFLFNLKADTDNNVVASPVRRTLNSKTTQ